MTRTEVNQNRVHGTGVPEPYQPLGETIEKLTLLVIAPLALVTLVLGWFYLMSRGRSQTSLTLKGLGVTIQVAHSPRIEQGESNE